MKKQMMSLVRFFISALLLYFVLKQAGLSEIWKIIRTADLNYMILFILVSPVLIFLSSWKWQVILKAQNINVSVGRLFVLYITGYFFNTFLPTNVGGDVVRAHILGKAVKDPAKIYSSVFLERFTGLTMLLFFAIIAFFLGIRELWDKWLILSMLVCIAGYVVLLAVIWNPAYFEWIEKKFNIKVIKTVIQKLKKFQKATLILKDKKLVLLFALFNSSLFYLFAVLNVYFCSKAFNPDMAFIDACIITPIVLVIAMIPISIGGWGLTEGAYFFTFARMGLGGPLGLTVGLLLRAKLLIIGIFGGLAYSFGDVKFNKKELVLPKTNMDKSADNEGSGKYFSSFEDVLRRPKSPLKKYQDIVIGNYSLGKLLKFEFLTFFLSSMPGILGLGLRQIFYKSIFKRLGKGSVINRSVSLRHTYKISINKNCVIDEYCMLNAQGGDDSKIELGDFVLLGRGTVVTTKNGTIKIDDYSNIGAYCRIGTPSKIEIGKYFLCAANCYIGGVTHNFSDLETPILKQGFDDKGGVVIDDDVWLGAGVTVLDGVKIGKGAIIGANSLVNKDIPAYAIAHGTPAKVVKYRNQ